MLKKTFLNNSSKNSKSFSLESYSAGIQQGGGWVERMLASEKPVQAPAGWGDWQSLSASLALSFLIGKINMLISEIFWYFITLKRIKKGIENLVTLGKSVLLVTSSSKPLDILKKRIGVYI